MTVLDGLGMLLIAAGLVFFVAGTVGMLRFPDALSRLHALTKADNLGLGLVILGLICLSGDLAQILRLLLIWLLVLLAGATACHLVAQRCRLPRAGEGDGR